MNVLFFVFASRNSYPTYMHVFQNPEEKDKSTRATASSTLQNLNANC